MLSEELEKTVKIVGESVENLYKVHETFRDHIFNIYIQFLPH